MTFSRASFSVDSAITATGARFGNVQALDPDTGVLEIVAQRGFRREFLDLFAGVRADEPSACGRALREGRRVVVEDVGTESSYAPYRSAAREAGYRSVQSTPLRAEDGEVVGVLSTHYLEPWRPSEEQLLALDLLAAEAAELVAALRAP